MKKYLMIEVEEITDAQKDGSFFRAIHEYKTKHPKTKEEISTWEWDWFRYHAETNAFYDQCGDRMKPPTHCLPNGLPSPDQVVEVEEMQIEKIHYSTSDSSAWEPGIKYPFDHEVPLGTKLGVFKLPEVQS